jgi:GNAT superfamily N-acetyltransferase
MIKPRGENMDNVKVDQQIVFLELDNSRWIDMERLFESRGGPKNCWCMVWRGTTKDRTDKNSRKTAHMKLVEEDVPVGVLGYLGNEPIAWCSIAPRSTYRDLGGIKEPGDDSETVWSIVCFFVIRKYRGQGIMTRLIEAAIEHAIQRGATVIEAYAIKTIG